MTVSSSSDSALDPATARMMSWTAIMKMTSWVKSRRDSRGFTAIGAVSSVGSLMLTMIPSVQRVQALHRVREARSPPDVAVWLQMKHAARYQFQGRRYFPVLQCH